MNQLHTYLDLDRTLFRTGVFDEQRWKLLAKWYPDIISLDIESTRQSEFYVHRQELYFYDFSAHMNSLNIDTSEIYERLRTSELADGRLEYDGVRKLVEWLRMRGNVRVLTFGSEDYQSLKVALCPSLYDVEIVITGDEKGMYFRSLDTSTKNVWMIDDKPIRNLPRNIQFVQANMDGELPTTQQWPMIERLIDIPGIIGE